MNTCGPMAREENEMDLHQRTEKCKEAFALLSEYLKPGTTTRRLPGDRNSPCRLPALRRVCRKLSQDRRTLPTLPAGRAAGAPGEERAGSTPRCLPTHA